MKVLVIGGGGMLGHKLVQTLGGKFELWTTLRTDFGRYEDIGIFDEQKVFENIDVEDFTAVKRVIQDLNPAVIINAIGIIKQLPSAKNVIATLTVNSIFPHRLAEISSQTGARLITFSTDCVFNGKRGRYTETDVSNTEDLYGKSKNLGEVTTENCLTIRTSIIGRELNTAHSLIEWFLSNEGKSVRGFTKAIYTGFPTLIMAEMIGDLIENYPQLQGLYHVSSEPISKYDLLNLVKDAYRIDVEIVPDNDFEIDRSLDSTRFREATGFQPSSWRDMINKMAADNALYKKKNGFKISHQTNK